MKIFSCINSVTQKRVQVTCTTAISSVNYLLEANVISILSETLTAHVQAILANEPMPIGAHTAEINEQNANSFMALIRLHRLILIRLLPRC